MSWQDPLRPTLNRVIERRAAAQFLGRIMPFFQIDKHFPSKASIERAVRLTDPEEELRFPNSHAQHPHRAPGWGLLVLMTMGIWPQQVVNPVLILYMLPLKSKQWLPTELWSWCP